MERKVMVYFGEQKPDYIFIYTYLSQPEHIKDNSLNEINTRQF
jgi:hypothetical protein